MLEHNKSYVISGEKILKLLELIEDLRDIAGDYAHETGSGYEIEDDFEKLIEEVLKSDIFSEIDLCQVTGQYTLNDIMERVGLKYSTNSNDDNSLPYGGAVPYGVFFPEEFPSKKFGKTILDFVSKEERECTEYKIFKQ